AGDGFAAEFTSKVLWRPASHRQRARRRAAACLPCGLGDGIGERRRLGAGGHPEIFARFPSDHATCHRRTLGPAADVAFAVTRMPALTRDTGRATAKPERG